MTVMEKGLEPYLIGVSTKTVIDLKHETFNKIVLYQILMFSDFFHYYHTNISKTESNVS